MLKRCLVSDRNIAAADRNSRDGLSWRGEQYRADGGFIRGGVIAIKHVGAAIGGNLSSADIIADGGGEIAIDDDKCLLKKGYGKFIKRGKVSQTI